MTANLHNIITTISADLSRYYITAIIFETPRPSDTAATIAPDSIIPGEVPLSSNTPLAAATTNINIQMRFKMTRDFSARAAV